MSPHLDDVALSCGGLVWEQAQARDAVRVWTICAGDPPARPLSPFAQALHARWETDRNAIQQRRREDIAACSRLGAVYRHFLVPDCIYRLGPGDSEHLYASEESLFGQLDLREAGLIRLLSTGLDDALPAQANVVCPLALGGHVDHRLTRAAAERLGHSLWYYADYPYVLDAGDRLNQLQQDGWKPDRFPVSDAALIAWQEAVAAYTSQISTFWNSLPEMRAALKAYKDQVGGISLWRPPENAPAADFEPEPGDWPK